MLPKKMFFPIGGGEELEERIFGALLVSKYFNTHLEILASEPTPSNLIPPEMGMPGNLLKELGLAVKKNIQAEAKINEEIFKTTCKKLDISVSQAPKEDASTAHLTVGEGYRSTLVSQQSKFCDMVIAAAPTNGIATATFESAVLESGKPVIVIPRVMKEFKVDNILIGWNNSPQASRAVLDSIPILKKAKKVHIISSKEYTKESLSCIKDLQNYLAVHDIDASFELVETTRVPGKALLNNAQKGNFDLIIAGAYGRKGLKELMLGAATRYLLEHTTIPTLMSH